MCTAYTRDDVNRSKHFRLSISSNRKMRNNLIRHIIINDRVFCNLTFPVQSIPRFSVAIPADVAADPHQQADRNSAQKTTASFAVAIQTAVQPTVVGKSHTFYVHTVHLTCEHTICNIIWYLTHFHYFTYILFLIRNDTRVPITRPSVHFKTSHAGNCRLVIIFFFVSFSSVLSVMSNLWIYHDLYHNE